MSVQLDAVEVADAYAWLYREWRFRNNQEQPPGYEKAFRTPRIHDGHDITCEIRVLADAMRVSKGDIREVARLLIDLMKQDIGALLAQQVQTVHKLFPKLKDGYNIALMPMYKPSWDKLDSRLSPLPPSDVDNPILVTEQQLFRSANPRDTTDSFYLALWWIALRIDIGQTYVDQLTSIMHRRLDPLTLMVHEFLKVPITMWRPLGFRECLDLMRGLVATMSVPESDLTWECGVFMKMFQGLPRLSWTEVTGRRYCTHRGLSNVHGARQRCILEAQPEQRTRSWEQYCDRLLIARRRYKPTGNAATDEERCSAHKRCEELPDGLTTVVCDRLPLFLSVSCNIDAATLPLTWWKRSGDGCSWDLKITTFNTDDTPILPKKKSDNVYQMCGFIAKEGSGDYYARYAVLDVLDTKMRQQPTEIFWYGGHKESDGSVSGITMDSWGVGLDEKAQEATDMEWLHGRILGATVLLVFYRLCPPLGSASVPPSSTTGFRSTGSGTCPSSSAA